MDRGPILKMGSIVVVGSNIFSRDWLEEIIPRLRPWEGTKLLMVGMSELKKPRRATLRVPGNRLEPGVVVSLLSHRHSDLLFSSKGASTALVRRMAMMHTGICLIQEPWIVAEGIRSLEGAGRMYRDPTCSVPKACILVKGFDALLLPAWCSRDLTAIKIKFPVGGGGSEREVVVAFGYFPYDSQEEPSPREVQDLVEYSRQRSIPLILECDANAHHIDWGSSDTNGCDALLQYLLERMGGKEDHRYIQFDWKERCWETRAFRNPRKTDWAFFRENLRNELQYFKQSFGITDELDHWALELGEIVNISSKRSCPWTIPKGTWGTPWWNRELKDMRRETGRTFNRAKNTRTSVDWQIHREAKRLPTGEYTTSEEECSKLLLEANFQGFRFSHEMGHESSGRNRQQRAAWYLAAKVVTPKKVQWAITNFQPFKAPGIDGIYPAFH
ncbi:hypothetical protein TSAR_004402 [Trichomalopsis sarcophagae]|uniref:DUF4780 domain-containing protein n=1 Tax=Trichomalopsis sarcophagae TaxID=543379 RepID=A0A232EW89_9HYME|nr:hypothetical protein TSAR_004402 [Trichomalopsis sarcophagae]